MSKFGRIALFPLLMLALASGAAFGQDEGGEGGGGEEGGGEAAPPAEGGGEAAPAEGGEMGGEMGEGDMEMHGLTLPKGKIGIAGSTVNINLSKSAVGKPFSLAPSVWYGVSDKLTVGLTHDGGTTPMSPSPAAGAGICLAGKDNGCAKVYNNVGVDALFSLAVGNFSVAAHPGLDFASLDPMFLQIRVGVLGMYKAGKISVTFDPRLVIGATKRDEGNIKQGIFIPVWVWFAATPKISIYLRTGLNAPSLSDPGIGDVYSIPLGVGANIMLNEKMGAGVDLLFPAPIGADLVKQKFDGRVLGLRFMYLM